MLFPLLVIHFFQDIAVISLPMQQFQDIAVISIDMSWKGFRGPDVVVLAMLFDQESSWL
jgi:hypothetical protein